MIERRRFGRDKPTSYGAGGNLCVPIATPDPAFTDRFGRPLPPLEGSVEKTSPKRRAAKYGILSTPCISETTAR